ncbi:MAG: GNAT family N-acetyltransferase [Thermoleophilia bacterium]|nr:GNAT family N-acetyltransferase [Thermoleophilia bacterium]
MADPPAGARDVILRDGTTLRLRRPVAADTPAVVELFAGLSERSLHFRFHGQPAVGARLVAPFLDPDGHEREALVATLADDGAERIVALASWARLREPALAEVAFAVEDALQGRGVGTRMLEQLAALAAAAGVEGFVAEVMAENRGMLRVFEDAGFDVSRTLAGGTIEVRFPIVPTEAYREKVDTRDHVGVVASLRPFFAPASVAVIGASARAGSIGGKLFANIVDGGFPGRAHPVNRAGEAVAGRSAFRSVAAIPEPVDLAVVCVPGEHVLDVAREALEHGVRALCVISAGFAEIGGEGVARQERLLALVRAHGARLVGPNCLGLAVTGCRLNATFARESFPPGPIGFASQSGALGLALLEKADARGLGFSAFFSIGNKADVSSNDLLEHWQDDPGTGIVLLYLESFGNPRKFARVARRVARRKPLLAMKSGTSRAGARAASSHTAALAGSEAAVNALFHQAGVIRATTLEELLDVATLYASGAAPRGRRVGVLTNAGGLGILCADACEAAGLELPQLAAGTLAALARLLPAEASLANPVDMLGSATEETYAGVLPLLLADPGLDAVVVLFVPAATVGADAVAGAVARGTAAGASGKPVLAVVMSEEGIPRGLRDTAGVAAFAYPESAAAALGRAADRADWLRRPAGTVPALPGLSAAAARSVVEGALGRGGGWLGADELRSLLAAYGVPLVAERAVTTVEEAVAAAGELGFPAVVKTATPGIHKVDVGGVALGLATADDVRAAAERIGPPLLVQPQVRGNAEFLAGLVQDPVFGPLVAFGPGGSLAELVGEASFRIAPLTDVDAGELVLSGRAGRLVRGFRAIPPSDAGALIELCLRLSRLGEELPEVLELDLNPVLGLEHGCVAVDARARVGRGEAVPRAKTW